MSADPKSQLAELLRTALKRVAPDQADTPITLDRPKQAAHGDFASNLALQMAKPLKRGPRELAGLLLAELPPSDLVVKPGVAGRGRRSRWNSSPPTPPARFMWATAAARPTARPWRTCWPSRVAR